MGAALSYQWYSNTTNINTGGTAISGATNASFAIPSTLTAGTYFYYVVVSVTGGATPITSAVATVTVTVARTIVEQGNDAGANINWILWSDGELALSGTGAMFNWNWDAPWYARRSDITAITIGSGITRIGDYAFAGLNQALTVSIPASVTIIGNSAFRNCNSIITITLPNGITEIGEYAFAFCENLTAINIPTALTRIEDYTFHRCENLTVLYIHAGVTVIEDYGLFGINGLLNINIDVANPNYSSIGGVLFNKAETTLLLYPNARSGHYIIPNGVTNIREQAFALCTNLTGVTFPNSITTIEQRAFEFSGLTAVSLPYGITTINEGTFSHCHDLTTVTIPSSVTVIESGAFEICGSLTSVTIPAGVTRIGNGAFLDCVSLTEVIFNGNPPGDFGTPIFSDGEMVFKMFDFALFPGNYIVPIYGMTLYYLPANAAAWTGSPDYTGGANPTWHGYPIAAAAAGTYSIYIDTQGYGTLAAALIAAAAAGNYEPVRIIDDVTVNNPSVLILENSILSVEVGATLTLGTDVTLTLDSGFLDIYGNMIVHGTLDSNGIGGIDINGLNLLTIHYSNSVDPFPDGFTGGGTVYWVFTGGDYFWWNNTAWVKD
jgi:hypothetical protein